MVTRNFGNKIMGAVLSTAMVLTAIPVCTMNSLACETDHYGDGAYISAQPVETTDLETLIDYYTSVINFFYDKEDVLSSDEDEQCRSIFNSVSLVMRDPDADSSDYIEASAALDYVVDLINNIIASAPVEDETPVETNEVSALDRLFALCDEVEQFISVFGSEVPEGQLFALQNALLLAQQVAVYADDLPESAVVEMTAQLNYYYNAAIDAADAAAQADQTPVEETANDDVEYDPQMIIPDRCDIRVGKTEFVEIVEDTVIETPVVTEAPAAIETPAASAPVGQVLGAERNRGFVVDQIIESLYVNALDRDSDLTGKTHWVNMILNGEADIDTVVRGFLNSAEFEARDLSDDAFIMVLYRVMFNRVPSADELNNWTAALAAGTTRNQVIDGFLNSAEFEAECAKYDL